MVDSGELTLDAVHHDKWENFEEENGEISGHCTEISASHQAPNNFTEHSELISEQKASTQQGNSSVNKENGRKATELRENLEDRSKNYEELPAEISSVGVQFDRDGVDDSSRLGSGDNALGVHESISKTNKRGLTAPSQSNGLSATKADVTGLHVNGGSESHLHSNSVAAASDSKGIADNTITPCNTSKWTTFQESEDYEESIISEVAKSGKSEHLPKASEENVENHPPLPLNTTTSKMAAFDSRQAAATTSIIPNLSVVTEPEAVKANSVSFKPVINAPNVSNAGSSLKSAVPIVGNNSAHQESNSSSTETQQQQQSRKTSNQGKIELGKNWVSFGEEGSQQKSDLGVSASGSDPGTLETAKRSQNDPSQQRSKEEIASPGGNNTTQTSGTVSSQVENKTTAVIPPVSFTSAELDFLASKSWIKFDDSNKTNQVEQPASSSAATQSWVTFGDSNVPLGQNLDLLELDVDSKAKDGSVPGPNPFISATPPLGSNPFKPPATNPFQADKTMSVSVSPHPVSNQGPISSSTPVIGTKPLLVSDIATVAQLSVTQQVSDVSNSALISSSANNGDLNLDQVDGRPVVLGRVEQEPVQENDEPLLEEKPVTSGSWSMLLRFPDKKRKIGSREWKPVVLKLEGTTLQIFEEYELSAPFREIPLQAYFVLTTPKLQSFEHGAKVHTIKLEYVKYTEGRSLKHRGTIEHIAQGTPIIKVASPSHVVIRELTESINNSLRLLPSYRDRGITYRHDEVFVDIDDVTDVLLSGDGTILWKNAKVLIKLRAFLTGDPECQLVLNDVVVREKEEARLRGELKPQRVHHWVKLRHCDFHKCVNTTTFNQSHAIMFHPLDACTFELMRFPVDHHKPLPLLVKTVLSIHSEQRVELKAEIQVCQETKMAKYVRNNVVFRFPIPESWVPLFRTGKVFRGEKSIKSSKGRRAAGIKSRLKHSKCSISVSLGKAMYEPEYGSVVWHIDHLPFIHSKIPADAPHTLNVVLDLPPGLEFPENYKPAAELEYDVAYVLVSDTTVIAVKVSNQNIPDKWVCYRALYHYDVNIDISRPSSGPVRDVGCIQQ